ncbi:aromatic acid exporter family protein [Aquibacillus kalidii]|uniref:aromatic acid exporter family protein n=1 Tax=Aquibacillus kalidii TaxID=2762597 RepID=UPI0016462767|nr:aromatic acid exporter family protein [Aquibacillus kalidii]
MKIGYRTLKTAIGTPLAIWIAELMQLDNYVSAGIITLLCIQPTRKSSFLTSWHRFGACVLSMLFAFIIFELIGYHPLAIGILLLLFIPTTIPLQLSPGIVTSSVILLHLYSSKNITLSLILNEFFIITIGIGVALVLNLYMPSLDTNLKRMQEKVEDNFRIILQEIGSYLRNGNQAWNGKEITETETLLKDAERLVLRDIENHLLRGKHSFRDYFAMRSRQFELLRRMIPLASQMTVLYEQSYRIADFLEELAEAVHPGNTAMTHLQTLRKLRREFEQSELPKTRIEFESRANLFRLLHEIEQYLVLKKNSTPRQKLRA